MNTITQKELNRKIKLHELYVKDNTKGKRLVLINYDLSYADLSGANLSYANLSYTNLSYANLSYTNLSYTNLSGADLSYANLSCADLSYTNLSYTNLSCADLSGANLSDADLSYANLSYADLSGADLSGANLRSACGNRQEIKSAQFLEWPLTWTASDLAIGCQQHSIKDWFSFDDGTIRKMGSDALTFCRKNKNLIKLMIEA